jgi:glutathione synthase/RimK-type ligase-like ATP-grasp enzyme
MKIAIHHREGSFSDRWIAYCEEKKIDYKIVNAYSNDIVQQVEGCDAFMWHFHQSDYRDMQFAKALIMSLETKGIRCFPDSKTCWHFDNKVWEKYLLEAIGAPMVPSYVFYTKTEALRWTRSTSFPKVFKLKGGASASNVRLAHTRKEAVKLIEQCFGKGFRHYRWQERFKESLRKHKEGKASLREVLRPIKYAFKRYPTQFDHFHGREIGYAYFQDFIPNNDHDTRVVVIGGKRALGEIRYCREGDFRASGSGKFEYGNVDKQILTIAFETAQKLKMQTVAFDFIMNKDKPLIVEISYGFGTHGISHSGGYWTSDMVWHEDKDLDFCGWMVEDLIKQ